MTEIIPAILPKNYEDLKNKAAQVRGLVKTVQIDICDGKFVKNISWPYDEMEKLNSKFQTILREDDGLPYWEEIEYELDLMVLNAHENFDLFLKLGAKRIIFHIEAEENVDEFKEFLEGIDLYIRDHTQIGVAINTTTPVSSIKYLVSSIDFVQCMGIEKIGYQGQPFDERVVDQIKALRKEYPELIISVDGGVNFDTAPKLIEAGANRLVAGSAIFNAYDQEEAIKELKGF
ncbi:MAG: Ribulose-phosphate 3-epimerase [Candidatus Nomurabacteria bacterium GW2011_GWB1_37_5]|uniref:Ribulose-phosphate 3-epimerase n=1 Tax=Candidatus Nomurabacteria bacterium GW2011_GWB1_37_5 TaxID=1618742 RepID=A0A0G0H789_9BACT|nr:MAG: Ribulose-phosphate 3-epimerase [Candidatus Nomurabacteria bacterium GW2011_GWB1_37_5]